MKVDLSFAQKISYEFSSWISINNPPVITHTTTTVYTINMKNKEPGVVYGNAQPCSHRQKATLLVSYRIEKSKNALGSIVSTRVSPASWLSPALCLGKSVTTVTSLHC